MAVGNRVSYIGPRRSFAYNAGQSTPIDLERGGYLQGLLFGMSGTLTCTDTNNTRAKTKRGDELGIIKRFAVFANSNDALIDLTGDDLWWMNRFWSGTQPFTNANLGKASTADPTFATHLFIPFIQSRSVAPEDTLLNTRILSNFSARIDWGTHTDINGDATGVSITNCFVQPVGFARRVPVGQEPIYSVCRRNVIEASVSGSNPAFTVRLPTGPIYRSFTFNTRNASGNDAQIVTDVSLKVGNTVITQCGWNAMSDYNDLLTGLGQPWNGALNSGTGLNQHLRQSSVVSSKAGWSNLDLATTGKLSEAVDSNDLGELYLEFNANAAGTIRILPTAISPAGRNIGDLPVALTIGA
jgi:hypothetical protein